MKSYSRKTWNLVETIKEEGDGLYSYDEGGVFGTLEELQKAILEGLAGYETMISGLKIYVKE